MKYLIGIDAGNTSSKVVIFDENGGIVSEAATPSMHTKRRGVGLEEFEVDELWDGSVVCIKEAIEKAKINPKDIAGIGVTSFGNGCVFLGKNGEAIAPGAFSQDYRANSIIERYKKEGVYDKINAITLGNLYAGEPGPSMRWYKDNDRIVYDKI
jgi:L-xylulokinase